MKSNPLPFVISLLIAGAAIYWYISGGTQQPSLTMDTSQNAAQVKFQTLVSELTPISFDKKIFSDARFNALIDLTTPITPESFGRLDPFAPIVGISDNE